jgi:hypothetical protein
LLLFDAPPWRGFFLGASALKIRGDVGMHLVNTTRW